jgi:hypothetical protein
MIEPSERNNFKLELWLRGLDGVDRGSDESNIGTACLESCLPNEFSGEASDRVDAGSFDVEIVGLMVSCSKDPVLPSPFEIGLPLAAERLSGSRFAGRAGT